MDGGVFASKHIHLDERLAACIYDLRATFPHEVGTRPHLELRVTYKETRGKGRTSWHPVLSLLLKWVGRVACNSLYERLVAN